MAITREQFVDYERIRLAAMTNMAATGMVADLSGLEREEVKQIRQNHAALAEKYPLTDDEKWEAEDLRQALLPS